MKKFKLRSYIFINEFYKERNKKAKSMEKCASETHRHPFLIHTWNFAFLSLRFAFQWNPFDDHFLVQSTAFVPVESTNAVGTSTKISQFFKTFKPQLIILGRIVLLMRLLSISNHWRTHFGFWLKIFSTLEWISLKGTSNSLLPPKLLNKNTKCDYKIKLAIWEMHKEWCVQLFYVIWSENKWMMGKLRTTARRSSIRAVSALWSIFCWLELLKEGEEKEFLVVD